MFNFKSYLILVFFVLIPIPSFAGVIADGIYTGAYKVVFVGMHNKDSKVGDTGVFEFIVKDNKIVQIHDYDDENFNKAKSKYYLEIDEQTGVIDGYFKQITRFNGQNITLKIYLDGKFIDNQFAGEALVQVIDPINAKLERLVFESLN
jgi:hypothetical protein